MHPPVNFDSVVLDALLNEWLGMQGERPAGSMAVLGPDPFAGPEKRLVLAVHPPRMFEAARLLAQSADFLMATGGSANRLVSWQHLSHLPDEPLLGWRRIWLDQGYLSLVRVAFSLPGGRAFECFLFSKRLLRDRSDAARAAWSLMNLWPQLRKSLVEARCLLSPRERECLALAFDGLIARESADRLGCSERTVNYHLANAMAKLKVDNKLAAIQRACWIGAI